MPKDHIKYTLGAYNKVNLLNKLSYPESSVVNCAMHASWRGLMADQMGWESMDEGWRKGPWTAQEDRLLIDYVKQQGDGRWNSVSRLTGLRRNGKSCRLRWVNYLRPDLKRGHITPQEEKIIVDLHSKWGNRWSTIARSLPGRTDNEIKNYWRTHFKKKSKTSTDNMETLRARLLRKQQFQLQQQLHLQQRQRQEQEQEFSRFDMKKIASLLEENDNRVVPTSSLPQLTTATIMYPNIINNGEEQGLFYSMLKSDHKSISQGSNDQQPEQQQQDMLWEGLWNMEDLQGNFSAFCATSKQANFLPHFVSPSY